MAIDRLFPQKSELLNWHLPHHIHEIYSGLPHQSDTFLQSRQHFYTFVTLAGGCNAQLVLDGSGLSRASQSQTKPHFVTAWQGCSTAAIWFNSCPKREIVLSHCALNLSSQLIRSELNG
jgi:hypothetical protein